MSFWAKLKTIHLWYRRLIIAGLAIISICLFIVAIYQMWKWMLIPAFAFLIAFYFAQATLWRCPHCGAPFGRFSDWKCQVCGKYAYEPREGSALTRELAEDASKNKE